MKNRALKRLLELTDEAKGRLMRTRKLLASWRNTLYHTKAQDPYKLAMINNMKDVIKTDFRIFDLKNTVKSDVILL
jgi:hypothetical protein